MSIKAPDVFCWTRFGTEAGQAIENILQRKEQERVANGGLFLWGIGNSLTRAITELLRRTDRPEVLFSPTVSRPRIADAAPKQVVAWTRGRTFAGEPYQLPSASMVTSSMNSDRKKTHYALVCFSDRPLERQRLCSVDISSLRNIHSGHPIGFSQVTCVVEAGRCAWGKPRDYPVLLRAELVAPYFVSLHEPTPVSDAFKSSAARTWQDVVQVAWAEVVGSARSQPTARE